MLPVIPLARRSLREQHAEKRGSCEGRRYTNFMQCSVSMTLVGDTASPAKVFNSVDLPTFTSPINTYCKKKDKNNRAIKMVKRIQLKSPAVFTCFFSGYYRDLITIYHVEVDDLHSKKDIHSLIFDIYLT